MSKGGNAANFDGRWIKRFLAALAEHGCVQTACDVARIDRQTYYNRRDADESFAKAAEEAKGRYGDALVREARRRAIDGVEEIVVNRGQVVFVWLNEAGEIVAEDDPHATRRVPLKKRIYSDALLSQALRAARPDEYRENVKVEHGGKLRHEHDARPLMQKLLDNPKAYETAKALAEQLAETTAREKQ